MGGGGGGGGGVCRWEGGGGRRDWLDTRGHRLALVVMRAWRHAEINQRLLSPVRQWREKKKSNSRCGIILMSSCTEHTDKDREHQRLGRQPDVNPLFTAGCQLPARA